MADIAEESNQLAQYFELGLEDAIYSKNPNDLCLNLRGLLASLEWSELEINKIAPAFGLTPTPFDYLPD